jgi:hypothetical protein
LIIIEFDPAPVMADVPDYCESCQAGKHVLKPIVRPIEITTGTGYPTVGYVCDLCTQIHLYR